MKNCIFLDIDGVLNDQHGAFLIKDIVRRFSEFVKEVDGKIVLISAWKDEWFPDEPQLNGYHIKELIKCFEEQNIRLFDKTDDNNSWRRGKGIRDYINNHSVSSFVVFDDDIFPDYEDQGIMAYLVNTRRNKGICDGDIALAKSILQSQN